MVATSGTQPVRVRDQEGNQLKFQKLYRGSDFRSLLKLYVRDLYNPEFRAVSYEDSTTGAQAIAL